MPPWTNIWLLMAMGLSFGLHFVLLYVETLSVSGFFQFSCLTYFPSPPFKDRLLSLPIDCGGVVGRDEDLITCPSARRDVEADRTQVHRW